MMGQHCRFAKGCPRCAVFVLFAVWLVAVAESGTNQPAEFLLPRS